MIHIFFKIWFKFNSMVANPRKFQTKFLGSKINNSKTTFATENNQIKCKNETPWNHH